MRGLDARKAFASLDMPPARYALVVALPLAATGLAIGILLHAMLRLLAPVLGAGAFALLPLLFPLFFLALAALYPFLVAERKKAQINHQIHFFITHMGVLATANIPRAEVIRILGEKKEYGPLADETRKIFTLVDSWNMSLAEACRFVSKRTPSDIWADFLDRFAYSMESGEDLETFLRNEQLVVMESFASMYRGSLYEVETMKGLYNSMMMSVIFVVIFAILMPILTGIDSAVLMGGAALLVLGIEVVFVYFTRAKAPVDPIWQRLSNRTPLTDALVRSLPISLLGCLVAVALVHWVVPGWPLGVRLATVLTPLLHTGLAVGRAEERVKRRDDNFAAFIRSLGASTSARGGQVTETLRHLQMHDFGPLTSDVRSLYARLNLRADDALAWAFFSRGCGSNLIEKFSRMFIEGVRAGGKADAIGRILSQNFNAIVALRKSRYQMAENFKGLLYGLVAGMAFALFVGVGIVRMLQGVFAGIDLGAESPFGGLFHFQFDVGLLGLIVILLLLAHSIASALMLHLVDGGAPARGFTETVGMFWVAVLVSWLAQGALQRLL